MILTLIASYEIVQIAVYNFNTNETMFCDALRNRYKCSFSQ